MPLFLRRSKSKGPSAKEQAPAPTPVEPRSKPVYKHVPTHAASDSMSGDAGSAPTRSSAQARRRHLSSSSLNAAALDDVRRGAHSPSSSPGSHPYYSHHKSPSLSSGGPITNAYFTDPDAPPLPAQATSLSAHPALRNSTQDYFTSASHHASSCLTPGPVTNHTKLDKLATDDSYAGPQVTDSGYASLDQSTNGSSRAPSEHNPEDLVKQEQDVSMFDDATGDYEHHGDQPTPKDTLNPSPRQQALDKLSAHDSGVCLKLKNASAADQHSGTSIYNNGPTVSNASSDSVSENGEILLLSGKHTISIQSPSSSTSTSSSLTPIKSTSKQPSTTDPISRDFAPPQDTIRRSHRPMSERSLSELSRAYVRPSMNSVPENHVAQNEIEHLSKDLFGYKGDLSADAAAAQQLAARMRQSQQQQQQQQQLPPSFISTTRAGALPTGFPYLNPKMAHVTGAGMPPPMRRRATMSGSSHAQLRPQPVSWNSFNAPVRSSPLASHETTPASSISGVDRLSIDERLALQHHASLNSFSYPNAHSRSASVRTSFSTATAPPARQRTYFSHGGKITVESAPSSAAASVKDLKIASLSVGATPAPATVTSEKQVELPSKKSSRFAFRRSSSAVQVARK